MKENKLKRLFAKYFQSNTASGSIFKNMAILVMGAGVAKAISLLLTPFITRIYSPEDFGVLSVFTSFTALIIPFSTLRYAVAIPLPRNEKVAFNLLILCITILVSVTVIIFIILILFGKPILIFLSADALVPYWWLIIIMIFGSGFYEILKNWAIREKSFKILAKTKVTQILGASLVKIGLGLLGVKPVGLLFGNIVSQAGGIFSLGRKFFSTFKNSLCYVRRKYFVFLFKYYSGYPKYRLPSQFLLAFSSKAPLLFFSWLYGIKATGQLGLSFTLMALPLILFGQTTGQAYFAEISRIGRKQPKEIYTVTKDVVKKLLFLSIIPFLFLLLFSPIVFPFVFGQQWYDAGVYTSILAPYLLFQFISSPIMNALNVLNGQKIFLRINIVRVLGVIFVFLSAYYLKLTPKTVLIIYSFFLSAHYLMSTLTVFQIINKKNICNE